MKNNRNKVITLVGKTVEIKLKYGHTFLAKPGFVIIRSHRNIYVITCINDYSARFYQGTAGGIIKTDIGLNDFARRFNIAENFVDELVPKMRERIWEWDSGDAVLDESMAFAVNVSKKYRAEELCDKTEYLILDSITNGFRSAYSWFMATKMPGVYEHRTIPAVFNEEYYDSEGFVVLTKQRLAKLCEAEARLYAAADATAECEYELFIDIDYGEVFKEPSEGFLYKHQESFEDEVLQNIPRWKKPVEKLPPHWWRETRDDDTEE